MFPSLRLLLTAALLTAAPSPCADGVVRILAPRWPVQSRSPTPSSGSLRSTPPTPPLQPARRTHRDHAGGRGVARPSRPSSPAPAVVFTNRDKIQHHVYSLSKTKRFEVPLFGSECPAFRPLRPTRYCRLGLQYPRLDVCPRCCLGHALLRQNSGGRCRNDLRACLPANTVLKFWHPRLASDTRRELTIAAGETPVQTISVVLKPARRIPRNPDAAGGGSAVTPAAPAPDARPARASFSLSSLQARAS